MLKTHLWYPVPLGGPDPFLNGLELIKINKIIKFELFLTTIAKIKNIVF